MQNNIEETRKNTMVLAERQTYGPMEQSGEHRKKSMRIWSTDLWQEYEEYTVGKDSLFSKWYWDIHMEKHEVGSLFYTKC